ncbi:bifunctional riboflavin kinase/FAD synthetase [Desulfobaculum bizertense]|uniref:Riboflavin biosynthesis protein n=1 Tax=Desulfobaculum bizertense DSM 18034 TaxID=1121442 RepID=A0A1T4WD51_9BACT|nr:bifunctional riboflavin kinase/FAD synthetase [Desulfobaculum bizertense]UIJ37407.1 bifunctional riboflavin kinase/FAD synthetase [Desulfobaculum bizertense]SKA75039.1 riboflavin kinase / FMN adenylyltransferase [Desulfobaculum bizertense DSM 18034]
MRVIRHIDEIPENFSASCVTIGNFDGVHKGHQLLIERTREKALSKGLASVVLTFEPHPLRVLTGKKTPPFITVLEQKLQLLQAMNVDYCAVLPFTKELAAQSPEEFVRDFLVRDLKAKELVIGYDYAFGKGRAGNYEMLCALGQKYSFGVERVGPYMYDSAVVSSTRIRDLVNKGQVWDARPLLGRFYTVRGEIEHGANRGGRLLGFPTANLRLVDELCPGLGVYAVWTTLNDVTRPGVANIGYNPTFGNDAISVEVHILDFDGDIYGDDLTVRFVQRLRSEKKFNGPQELTEQIDKDIALSRKILSSSEAQL